MIFSGFLRALGAAARYGDDARPRVRLKNRYLDISAERSAGDSDSQFFSRGHMAKVYPFRGLCYSRSKVSIEKVVTQPYDKISKVMQDRYYAQHPNNIIRIVLGKQNPEDTAGNNVYTRAAAALAEWRASGVLERIDAPAFFVYFQRFTIPGTNEVRERRGFIGVAQLEDYKNKIVFPHERTLTGPKKDRLELLRHTRTHFEQIFMLYEDRQQRIDRTLEGIAMGAPDVQLEDEYGVTHTLWMLTDRSTVDFIQREMNDKRLLIADGHHRYETALAYRDEMRAKAGAIDPKAPYERLTMCFFNMDAPGLTILPTHRVLSNVDAFDSQLFFDRAGEFFDITPAPHDPNVLRAALQESGEKRVSIGVFTDGGSRCSILSLKSSETPRPLDVNILHRLLIEKCLGISEEAVKKESHIAYVREMDAALNAVKGGNAQISFLLNPTGLHRMRDIAYEGDVMPQKSTDFYPKVLSGLVMYTLED